MFHVKHSTYSEFNKSIQNHIEKKKDLTLPLELLLYTLSTNRGEVVICVNEDEFSNLFQNVSIPRRKRKCLIAKLKQRPADQSL